MSKVVSMERAVGDAIADGDSVYMGGFTHLIPFAAGHEIIRQGRRGLTLIRATPDLIFDQMIATGCADKVVFSWAGNPGVGSLRCFRRAVEDDVPHEIEIEEYSHFGLISRISGGARQLPFVPLRTFIGSDYPAHNDAIKTVDNPYEEGIDDIPVVPPLHPDVAIVRAQRADEEGSAHLWGILGDIVEAAFAAETVILSVEELVSTDVIRSDPNRTKIPSGEVDYVVEEPFGSHPSYAQGYYDRDNTSYIEWDERSETHDSTLAWLDEWVHGVSNRREYLTSIESERLLDLEPGTAYATPVDYGTY